MHGIVISPGCSHDLEIYLPVDNNPYAIAQDAVVFYKKNLDLSHTTSLSIASDGDFGNGRELRDEDMKICQLWQQIPQSAGRALPQWRWQAFASPAFRTKFGEPGSLRRCLANAARGLATTLISNQQRRSIRNDRLMPVVLRICSHSSDPREFYFRHSILLFQTRQGV